jgi:outer membrane protein
MKVNLRSITTMAAIAAFSLVPVSGARAQGAAAATAPVKIGMISLRNAIVATAEGKQALAQLQSQFAPKQNELQNMQKQIEDIQRRVSEGARTLSDEEKAKLQRQYDLLTRRFQRDNDDATEEFNAAQNDAVEVIGRKLIEVLDRYARENGYTVVLDTSAQAGAVVYASATSDITQEIVTRYDQAYPVKSGAPAAAAPTPAPKPATPAPAKKPTP